ncbi:hypothetical protein P280DRAFT_449672 [Massarina eburnea CBS 473.64]|uniref:RNA-dependent RNA polymerase n=1 Tax=Massarina eburnea CBS 473.64 TaxID=1395130 RepID=A0A6A6S3M9_9PLEO|nr:hypothetical protein P280DRAFT_449672 [Massarina eburnea CBS 473.64]
MRGNVRFQSQGSRGQSAGPGAPHAPAPAPAPNTPRRRDGAGLNALIRSVEAEWRLGLQARDDTWSPSQTTHRLADKVCGQLKRLHYSSGAELDRALASFRLIAPGFEQSKRLELLHGTLKSQTRSPVSGTGTGTRGLDSANNGPTALRSVHIETDKCTASEHNDHRPSSTGPFRIQRSHEPAPDPGSPTDDDEDFVTPPSPILSSVSAQRRVQASSRFPSGPSTSRKRASDSSHHDTGNTPKLTKTSKGNQPSDRPPDPKTQKPVFKKPALEMARSFQSGPISMKSSFTNSSFNTMSSSQQTQADTAVTSFTSDAYDADVPKLTRTSSTTMGSLDDQDLLNVSAQLEREIAERLQVERDRINRFGPSQSSQLSRDPTRESSSTFGSVDEDALLETSFRVETQFSLPEPVHPPPDRLAIPPIPSPSRAASTGISPPEKTSDNFAPTIESPSRMPYYIRDIPDQNLFSEELPSELLHFPYFILFICCRLANEQNISVSELMSNMDLTMVRDPVQFWEEVKVRVQATPLLRDSSRVWSSAQRNFEGFTFKGKVGFKASGQVFELKLEPIQADRSCRFQRKFGSHRFLYLTLPSFDAGKPNRFTVDNMEQIQERFKSWFHQEHSFLGRKWRAFHIEPIRSKKKGKTKDENSDKRMVLFATEGAGLDPISIGEMLDWFFPFAGNSHQNFCKAYARIDLGLSRTIPTLVFKPSQVRFVPDIIADGTPECTKFNDQRLYWHERAEKKTVMNDGCSKMSVGAALEIWKKYRKATNRKEPIPSVFQGRIGGAKGMWMVCGEPSTNDPAELEIWIDIADSQLKFQPWDDDLLDNHPYDPHRLTFEYVGHSSSPGPSELHISFIPILVDRGVALNDIKELMIDRLDMERDELLNTLPDAVKIYHWLHQQSSTDEDPPWQAGLPQSLPNKIRHLVQSGFYPAEEPYLAKALYRFIKMKQLWMEQKLKVPLGKATFLYGIADPLGVLKPGEVHVDFSSPFVDEITGSTYRALNNIDLLVARQPACRRSDIQKVRAVKKSELAHLVDVVVFPSRGEYPMAGRLQGGDYDGDTFWLCWDSILVEPFQNAPAPLQALDEAKYGIKKDSRKLRQIMDSSDLSTVDNLLREVLDFRMAPSLLGMVTIFLEKQAYKENRMYSDRLNALCDMHDLLVDAPKQGYLFSKDDWTLFTRNTLRCGNPKIPAYKQAMEDCESAKELGDADKVREKSYKHKRENVLDYLYFDVVRTHDVATLKSIQETLPKEISDDAALQFPYLQLRDQGSDAIKAELASLVPELHALDTEWRLLLGRKDLKSDQYNRTLSTCYTKFCALLPSQPISDASVIPLLEPYLHPDFHVWKYIRASAIYTELPKRHSFVWHMAGRELMELKCANTPGAVYVTGNIFFNMKPKPIRAPRPEYDDDEDESEGDGGSEDEFQQEGLGVVVGKSPAVRTTSKLQNGNGKRF